MNGSITAKKESRTCQELIKSPIPTNRETKQEAMGTDNQNITKQTQILKIKSPVQPESPQVLHQLHSIEIENVPPKTIHRDITHFDNPPLEKHKDDSNKAILDVLPESPVSVSSS